MHDLKDLLCAISIHVLREEDDTRTRLFCRSQSISIHVLREEDDLMYFLPFHPSAISIHVLREEDDCRCSSLALGTTNFNPRPPRGGRQQKYTKNLCIFCAKGTIISPPGGVIRCIAAKRKLQHSTV